jgi:hypothetical protein
MLYLPANSPDRSPRQVVGISLSARGDGVVEIGVAERLLRDGVTISGSTSELFHLIERQERWQAKGLDMSPPAGRPFLLATGTLLRSGVRSSFVAPHCLNLNMYSTN